MDATELLTSDHNAVRSLFDDFRGAVERGAEHETHEIQQAIFQELETHTRIEEEIFYPEIRRLDETALGDMVDESLQDHDAVKLLMGEIADTSDLEVFRSNMATLMADVEQHAQEEEQKMFPVLRDRMGPADLEDLGEQLEAAKG